MFLVLVWFCDIVICVINHLAELAKADCFVYFVLPVCVVCCSDCCLASMVVAVSSHIQLLFFSVVVFVQGT